MGYMEVAREINRYVDSNENFDVLQKTIQNFMNVVDNRCRKATVGRINQPPEVHRYEVIAFTKNYRKKLSKGLNKSHTELGISLPHFFEKHGLRGEIKDAQENMCYGPKSEDNITVSLNFTKFDGSIKFCNTQVDVKRDVYTVSFMLNSVDEENKTVNLLAFGAKRNSEALKGVHDAISIYNFDLERLKVLRLLEDELNLIYKGIDL